MFLKPHQKFPDGEEFRLQMSLHSFWYNTFRDYFEREAALVEILFSSVWMSEQYVICLQKWTWKSIYCISVEDMANDSRSSQLY